MSTGCEVGGVPGTRRGQHLTDRQNMLCGARRVDGVVKLAVYSSLDRGVELVKETAAETGMVLDAGRGRDHVVTTDRRVSVVAGRTQGIFGNVEDGAYFWVREFSGPIAVPGLPVSFPFAPKFLREHKFTADVFQARDLVWKRSGSKQQIAAD